MSGPMLMGFVIYLVVMLGVGLIARRRSIIPTEKGKIWGRVPSAPVFFYGMWLLLAFPGFIYASGLNGLWLIFGLVLGVFVCMGIVHKRLRQSAVSVGAHSLPDYFERRFHDSSGMLKKMVALVMLVFSTVLIAAGLLAAGKLLMAVLGINLELALGVSAIIFILFYLLPGTKLGPIQGVLVFLMIIAIPSVIIAKVGGVAPLLHRVADTNPDLLQLAKSVDYDFADKTYWLTETASLSPLMVMSLLSWGLGYFGQPRLLTRLMRTRSGAGVMAGWEIGVACAITLSAVGLSGLFAIALFAKPLPDPESLLFLLLQVLAPPFIAGLLLAVIFAAILYLLRSQCMLIATTIVKDICGKKNGRWLFHGGVLLVIAIGWLLAAHASSVFFLFSYAWAGFGASLGPALLLTLYWRQTSGISVLAGVMAGGMTVFLWQSVFDFKVFALGPGFVVSWLVMVTVCLLTRRRADPNEEKAKA